MNRYKCSDCGGFSYSASPYKTGDPCPYCGGMNNKLEGIGEPTLRTDLLQRAIDTWGRHAQVDMMIEEMSELTKALLKERRKPPLPLSGLEKAIADIREEMADVQIMLDQMKLIYGDPADIEAEKLSRLEDRLATRRCDSE